MKKIFSALILISSSMYAQNYEKNWNKVIENENNGKIKSATAIVSCFKNMEKLKRCATIRSCF
jgi:hypothetical protein